MRTLQQFIQRDINEDDKQSLVVVNTQLAKIKKDDKSKLESLTKKRDSIADAIRVKREKIRDLTLKHKSDETAKAKELIAKSISDLEEKKAVYVERIADIKAASDKKKEALNKKKEAYKARLDKIKGSVKDKTSKIKKGIDYLTSDD